MINGTVTPEHEAIIRLGVYRPDGSPVELDAAVDTGFNGFLTLPATLVDALSLPFEGPAQATLADGSIVPMEVYRATVIWEGQDRALPVLAADGGPLVGMLLLRGYKLSIDVVPGGSVKIEPLN